MGIKILFHYPCVDGVFGALAARLWLDHKISKGLVKESDIKFVPHTTWAKEDEISAILNTFTKEDEIYLIDHCGRQGFLQEACQKAGKVILLDHHDTAQELVDEMEREGGSFPNFSKVFDTKKSGATIAMDYFDDDLGFSIFPEYFSDDARIELLQIFRMVQDYDTWKFSIVGSKAFTTAIYNMKLEFDCNKNPGIFKLLMSLSIDRLVDFGQKLLRNQEAEINAALKRKYIINFSTDERECKCYAVEFPKFPEIGNDLGNDLALLSDKDGMTPMGVVSHPMGEGRKKLCLRAASKFDTTLVSRYYNGGGHRNSSGCIVDLAVFEKLVAGHDTE